MADSFSVYSVINLSANCFSSECVIVCHMFSFLSEGSRGLYGFVVYCFWPFILLILFIHIHTALLRFVVNSKIEQQFKNLSICWPLSATCHSGVLKQADWKGHNAIQRHCMHCIHFNMETDDWDISRSGDVSDWPLWKCVGALLSPKSVVIQFKLNGYCVMLSVHSILSSLNHLCNHLVCNKEFLKFLVCKHNPKLHDQS